MAIYCESCCRRLTEDERATSHKCDHVRSRPVGLWSFVLVTTIIEFLVARANGWI
jgi:hypothetical protein